VHSHTPKAGLADLRTLGKPNRATPFDPDSVIASDQAESLRRPKAVIRLAESSSGPADDPSKMVS
jgi:hypothetical protein